MSIHMHAGQQCPDEPVPQSYRTQPWNAHVKDRLENELHRLVCAGQLPLDTAQRDIATDWIAAYQAYFHTIDPSPRPPHGHANAARVTVPDGEGPHVVEETT